MELLLIQSQEHDKLPLAELNAVLETEEMDVEIEKVHPVFFLRILQRMFLMIITEYLFEGLHTLTKFII